MRKLAALSLCATLLTGCSLGPDYVAPEMDIPHAWSTVSHDEAEGAQDTVVSTVWWNNFADATLDTLVDEVLKHNDDLAIAMANVEVSRAQLGVATSYLFHTISADGSGTRARPSDNGATPPAPNDVANGVYNLSGMLSFELDLWGKYRRGQESVKAALLSSEASYATIRLSVISQTVDAYFTLRSLDSQLAIARYTLESRIKSEGLRKDRFDLGLSTELDFRQAQAETASTRVIVRQYEQSVAAAETALAVLLGRSPRDIIEIELQRGVDIALMEVPADIPAGLPASLLARRPDIAVAAQNLHMATALIGYTQADLLPSISLTGLLGLESLDVTTLLDSHAKMWSYGASLSVPLFTFGRTLSKIDEAEASQRGAVATYEKTVRLAFAEVRNALIDNRKTGEISVAYAAQVLALRRSLKLATSQYNDGLSDYLNVLEAERSLFQAELALVDAHRARLSAVVALCKSLGGGWTVEDLNTPTMREPEALPEDDTISDDTSSDDALQDVSSSSSSDDTLSEEVLLNEALQDAALEHVAHDLNDIEDMAQSSEGAVQ